MSIYIVASTEDANESSSISNLKALRIKNVQEKTGLCKSAIYAKAKVGQFPAPIKLGGSRTSGWLEHEIDFWLHQQIQASRIGGVV
jgi:prophage regulatory protein